MFSIERGIISDAPNMCVEPENSSKDHMGSCTLIGSSTIFDAPEAICRTKKSSNKLYFD